MTVNGRADMHAMFMQTTPRLGLRIGFHTPTPRETVDAIPNTLQAQKNWPRKASFSHIQLFGSNASSGKVGTSRIRRVKSHTYRAGTSNAPDSILWWTAQHPQSA